MASLDAVGSGAGSEADDDLALWLMNNGDRHWTRGYLLLLVPGFATVGAIIVARHRSHVVG